MFLAYKPSDGIRYGTLVYFFLSVMCFSSGADAHVPYFTSAEQFSQTGFVWWKTFIHERRMAQRDALVCFHAHDNSCWSALAQKIEDMTREAPYSRLCVPVRLREAQYWASLSEYTRSLAMGLSSIQTPPKRLYARLAAARDALRRMADEGVCGQ